MNICGIMLNEWRFVNGQLTGLLSLPILLLENYMKALPLDGWEGLGGGEHPPLDPLPSREGKSVVGHTIDTREISGGC
jgi:hypothetical protein